jgi:hypothetical protein
MARVKAALPFYSLTTKIHFLYILNRDNLNSFHFISNNILAHIFQRLSITLLLGVLFSCFLYIYYYSYYIFILQMTKNTLVTQIVAIIIMYLLAVLYEYIIILCIILQGKNNISLISNKYITRFMKGK